MDRVQNLFNIFFTKEYIDPLSLNNKGKYVRSPLRIIILLLLLLTSNILFVYIYLLFKHSSDLNL